MHTYTIWLKSLNTSKSRTFVRQNAAFSFLGTKKEYVCISEYLKPNFFRLCMFCCLYWVINTWHYILREMIPELKVFYLCIMIIMGGLFFGEPLQPSRTLSSYNILTRLFQYGANFCKIFQFITGSIWIQAIMKWIFLLL